MQTVLIADPNPAVRRLIRLTVATPDRVVLEAADTAGAWAALRQARPDAVILDELLPGQGGVHVARAIQRDPTLKHTLVILVSTRARTAGPGAGLATGIAAYLTKPFSPLVLLRLLQVGPSGSTQPRASVA